LGIKIIADPVEHFLGILSTNNTLTRPKESASTAHYELGAKDSGIAGLATDAKNQILFVERRNSGATGAVQEVGGGAPVTQRRRAASNLEDEISMAFMVK
jgi:hypothetical protein